MRFRIIAAVAVGVMIGVATHLILVYPRIGPLGNHFAPGFSACLRCRTPWRFVVPHITHYTDWTPIEVEGGGAFGMQQRGCFPLCEPCWRELETPLERLPYYFHLLAEWERGTPGHVTPEMRARVESAVFEEREHP